MRTYMIIPTYWSGPDGKWEEGDAVYDHATPLNENGTLLRTLKSIEILNDKHFTLIILAAATNKKYIDLMEQKIRKMLEREHLAVDTLIFTENNLNELKQHLYEDFDLPDVLHLRGYSNVRNLCLFLPYILDAEIAILIDDDEVFEDPDFVGKAKEFIGKRFYGNTIDGVAGYYLNEDNNYYDKVHIVPWMTYWDRFGGKREAFDRIIGSEPRLKKTPFAFGGAMVIHRNLMRIVPFDPNITRGEDTDYVINSRIFGFNFYLDNQLAIKHLPPPKDHPVWKRFREDIYRFLYDKSKFDHQNIEQNINLHEIKPEDFDPYPGQFMKPDLGDKIFKTNIILALNYLSDGDVDACHETIKNIYLARYEAVPHYDTYTEYLNFQKSWRKLLEHTKDFGDTLKKCILKCQVIKHDKYQNIRHKKFDEMGVTEDLDLQDVALFKHFDKRQLRKLFYISELQNFAENDFVYKAGELDQNVYIVLQGLVEVMQDVKDSSEDLEISVLESGDHFNESSIFFDHPHTVSVRAQTDVILMAIPREEVLKLIQKNNEMSSKMLWELSKKLSEKLKSTTEKYTETHNKTSDVSDHMEELED